jgi:hypothetical protein
MFVAAATDIGMEGATGPTAEDGASIMADIMPDTIGDIIGGSGFAINLA